MKRGIERKLPRIFLSSAVLSTQIGIVCAWSAETGGSIPPIQRSNEEASFEDIRTASGLTVFDRRWPSQSKEFVIGADGVATAVENSGETARQASQSANPSNAYAVTGALPDFGGMANDGSSNHIKSATSNRLTASSVPECGPSPLPPEKIKALVEQAARRHQVDELFADAITWAESRFDRSRNSDRGARGPMQLMPDTAARFGVGDACDPEANIEGGVKYLRVLLDEFRNPLVVAAAYNAGESRIYEYGGIPPFKETVSYVAKIVNYQIGSPMPTLRNKVPGKDAKLPLVTASRADSGVIAVDKTDTFVGGVMRF